MRDGISLTLIVLSLLVAGWGALTCALNRPAGRSHLVAGAAVEAVTLVQLAVGIAAVAGGDPDAKAMFLLYLLGCALLPPAAGFLALVERTRWGSAVVAVAGLLLPVLVVRLQQIWDGAGA
ncbi:hypothetical protein AQ490_15575 [Wenjunlia vitaminophila]|uniref:Uncharacterized protein n=1 Tax=Wenjunlia vitaminophila TaxID=76728 RepID=A0A0T6LXC0_WENVI|nr:hypothetical protein [Wenjunlia vitaminophila]KRV50498.1 hypothetical protein AQ490_15575 [Wenjunlia vitaminophila]